MGGILQPLYDELEANYPIEVWSGYGSKYLYVPVVSSVVYMLLIYFGRKLMHERAPFKLRTTLTVWNATLAVFSILGTFVMVPPLITKLSLEDGFYRSVCFNPMATSSWIGFWAMMFVLSKLVEFGDTFFIVLRKTPLNFLHWYHHITVLLYSWYGVTGLPFHDSSTGHWFCAMNFVVHSTMYTYYTVKSTGFRVSSSVAKFVTVLQLSQFFVGLVVVLSAYWYHLYGRECDITWKQLMAAFLMYGSYFVLFINFFYHRYIKEAPPKKEKKEQ